MFRVSTYAYGASNKASIEKFPVAIMPSNLPNLRRLFVEARTEAEESAYSRNAFYNLGIFLSSIAIFSLVAQRMTPTSSGPA
ncbi:hypothetical protein BDY21DRAFT_344158 [Lineolata rhizophorae]|uniref:Uncharacterized protein n=1 Tax=Lineolata rhizophorae TaxID=578093 RepID=A0A6A6P267_9PEZI|nr:hypothetical protein BDY21DRAFT_344158 [Lineolata rhizophorae]